MQYWFHHLGVAVANLEAAIEWYDRVLGFACIRRGHIPSANADMAMLQNGDLHVELLAYADVRPASEERRVPDSDLQTCGNKHVSFACADVHALTAEIRARGGDIVWVKDHGEGRANMFMRDLEGNLIEFIQTSPIAGGGFGALEQATVES